ncbi:MAG: heme exporter protein CcmD [Betaproteobacteria bacterium]|nr:heme exporter protein CcmD [Betaproteobacteria bacterium]
MTEHQFFILGAYGVSAVALAVELLWLWLGARRSLAALREARQMGDA